MDRRRFLRLLLAGLAGAVSPLPLVTPARTAGRGFDPDRLLVGERHDYDISFWWFDRVGTIAMSFHRLTGGRGYLALAGGKTLGIIGFLTRYREDRYRTFMRYDEKLGMLLPYRFEEHVIVGKEVDRVVRVFDHDKGKIFLYKARPSGVIEKEIHDMPAPTTVDYLSAYYNLRGGVYGPPTPGRTIRVPTMPNQETKEIKITFLDEKTAAKMRREDEVDWPHYAHIFLNPKLTRSKGGRIDGWLNDDLVPELGVIRDVLFFGDIRGRRVASGQVQEELDLYPLDPLSIRVPRKTREGR